MQGKEVYIDWNKTNVKLDNIQNDIYDKWDNVKPTLIIGCAGSGKTLLLVELLYKYISTINRNMNIRTAYFTYTH